MKPRRSVHWLQRQPLIRAMLWALVPSVAALLVAPHIPDDELRKVIFAGGATLLFGAFFGGMVKFLLDELAATARLRDDAASFVSNVLGDLKHVYDQVARARILIPAHKSAKTYGEEMRGMIDARVQLRNVVRALERRAEGLTEETRVEVTRRVENKMEKYIETLTCEFRDSYKELSDAQRGYEARADAMVTAFAEGRAFHEPPTLPPFVWERITKLPALADFIGDGTLYREGFEDPLDAASELLRAELAKILRSTAWSGPN
jgi:hypothetical protein